MSFLNPQVHASRGPVPVLPHVAGDVANATRTITMVKGTPSELRPLCGGYAGNNVEWNAGAREVDDFFAAPPEHQWISPLRRTTFGYRRARRTSNSLISCWGVGWSPLLFPTSMRRGGRGEIEGVARYEPIIDHDVSRSDNAQRTKRQQIGRARARADEIYRPTMSDLTSGGGRGRRARPPCFSIDVHTRVVDVELAGRRNHRRVLDHRLQLQRLVVDHDDRRLLRLAVPDGEPYFPEPSLLNSG